MVFSGRGKRVAGSTPGVNMFQTLKAVALVSCIMASSLSGYAQQAAPQPAAAGLPAAPVAVPNYTQPLFMRPGPEDYTKARGYFPNPLAPYRARTTPPPSFLNSPRLNDLLKDGKIYLSLSDAIMLALENNFDIAIQRFNLNIADTDILRARAGSQLLGVSSGLVEGTIGSTGTTLTAGGGPGGTSVASGGAGTGSGGLSLTTNGGGPTPEAMDPVLTGSIQLERQTTEELSPLFYGTSQLNQNSNTYNFGWSQGFITGTALNVTFNNSYTTSNSLFSTYSPALQTTFNAQVTQHLLQGFGWGVNGRFIVQAKNNRRIADSAFRAQLLYTINQVENIYWGLVSAYEDLQSRTRALQQSTALLEDDKKSLQIGTLAPLDVVNANSQVETDRQGLIASQSNLEYQQLVMKQAIARTLEDPAIANAPVIPTDRVSLVETPEEHEPADDLVRLADANSPSIEQAILNLKNDEITLKGVKNGLLPTVDLVGFYGASALGGRASPNCENFYTGEPCGNDTYPTINYSNAFQNLFNSTSPNKGVGLNINIPIRNRTAQAEQTRSILEYRQAQMRLQQLYVQTRMNVVNAQFALTNDRASVQSAVATRDYDRQSLEAELKKLHLGASTTANVLQQERTLATAENNVISATAKYAVDRAALSQILASTLDRYNISITDAVTGNVQSQPVIPGLQPVRTGREVTVPAQQDTLHQQMTNPPQPR